MTHAANHAPGPWSVAPFDSGCSFEVTGSDGAPICSIRLDPRQQLARRTINAANARLIAAAPDLLAALKEIVDHGARLSEEALSKARAVIAQAEGGA